MIRRHIAMAFVALVAGATLSTPAQAGPVPQATVKVKNTGKAAAWVVLVAPGDRAPTTTKGLLEGNAQVVQAGGGVKSFGQVIRPGAWTMYVYTAANVKPQAAADLPKPDAQIQVANSVDGQTTYCSVTSKNAKGPCSISASTPF